MYKVWSKEEDNILYEYFFKGIRQNMNIGEACKFASQKLENRSSHTCYSRWRIIEDIYINNILKWMVEERMQNGSYCHYIRYIIRHREYWKRYCQMEDEYLRR